MGRIEEKVKYIVGEYYGMNPDDVNVASNFVDELSANSFLDRMELGMAMEQAFGLAIPDEGLENLHTIQDAIDYVRVNLANKKP